MRFSTTLAAAAAAALSGTSVAQISGKCTGQSCAIANLSGSTGQPYDTSTKSTGGSDSGLKCIQSYAQYGAGKTVGPTDPRLSAKFVADRNAVAATCKPNTLLFARGTFEPGSLGVTIGPMLNSQLGNDWSVQGVDYSPDIAGDDCVGLPGGVKCLVQLNALAAACPSTKIIVGGYSQGAMVSHNCVAFASDAVKARVAGVLLFGDPFNGAAIKGYPTSKLKTFCTDSDGVCQGKFQIGAGHLAYLGNGDVGKALSWMNSAVKA